MTENINQVSVDEMVEVLRSSHNLILNGAPGTGKTYLARKIAEELVGKDNIRDNGESENIVRVQFHPSYDYTDFVEGLRPVNGDNGAIGFERRDGVFKRFCAKAIQNLSESKMTILEKKEEVQKREVVLKLLEEARVNKTKFKKEIGTPFTIEGFDDDESKVRVPKVYINTDDTKNDVTVTLRDLITCFEKDDNWSRRIDLWKEGLDKRYKSSDPTYLFGIYNNLKEKARIKEVVGYVEVSHTKRQNFVFIIDEINRGEISKIFGELFLSIEPSYRGTKGIVHTQYQNLIENGESFEDGFYIPENVYIIGTMNDIDRSVESMDFAMRRRFTFHEVTAESRIDMLDETLDNLLHKNEIDEAKNRLANLNERIENIVGLNASYHIGPAYFTNLSKYVDNQEDKFKLLWQHHIYPLVREYVRGMQDEVQELAGLKAAYDTKTRTVNAYN